MKKNLIARLGVLALVFTLVTTSLVSGTYSKYVKEVTGSDTARVAKFAFNLKDDNGGSLTQAESTGSFNIFDNNDAGVYIDASNTNVGTDSKKLIAPGTTGTVTFTVENLSEVKVKPSFAITETNDGNIPIYYTFGGKNYSAFSATATGVTLTGGGLSDLAAALSSATASPVMDASDGTTAIPQTYALTWTWGFERGTAGDLTANDAADTALGIAGTATVKLDVAITVTQQDT